MGDASTGGAAATEGITTGTSLMLGSACHEEDEEEEEYRCALQLWVLVHVGVGWVRGWVEGGLVLLAGLPSRVAACSVQAGQLLFQWEPAANALCTDWVHCCTAASPQRWSEWQAPGPLPQPHAVQQP